MKTVITVEPRDLWEIFKDLYKLSPDEWKFKGGSGSITMTLVKEPKPEFFPLQEETSVKRLLEPEPQSPSFQEAVKKSQEAYKKSLETKPKHKPAWKIDREREQEEREKRNQAAMNNIKSFLEKNDKAYKMGALVKLTGLQDQQIRRLIYRMPQEIEIVGSGSARKYKLKDQDPQDNQEQINIDWGDTEKISKKEREEQEEAAEIEEAD